MQSLTSLSAWLLQLQNIAEFIQTFVMLVDNPENQLVRTSPFILCQHMRPQLQCRVLPDCPFPCPSPEDIKYRMVRLSLDSIDLFMVEVGSALNLSVSRVFFVCVVYPCVCVCLRACVCVCMNTRVCVCACMCEHV